jgi:hypothetical protein
MYDEELRARDRSKTLAMDECDEPQSQRDLWEGKHRSHVCRSSTCYQRGQKNEGKMKIIGFMGVLLDVWKIAIAPRY